MSYFFRKFERMSNNGSSAAVVIGALRVKALFIFRHVILNVCYKGIVQRTPSGISGADPSQ